MIAVGQAVLCSFFVLQASADFAPEYEAPGSGITKWDAEELSEQGEHGTVYRQAAPIDPWIWDYVNKFHDPLKEADVEAVFQKVSDDNALVAQMRAALRVTFTALPKSSNGRLPQQTARYALHRHFLQERGMFLRGLQPADRQMAHVHNSTREWTLGYLDGLFAQGADLVEDGFDLQQLASFAAMIDTLIEKETEQSIEILLGLLKMPKDGLISSNIVKCVLETHAQQLSVLDIVDADKNATAKAFNKFAANQCGDPDEAITNPEFFRFMAPEIQNHAQADLDFATLVQKAHAIEKHVRAYTQQQCNGLRSYFQSLELKNEDGYIPLNAYYEGKSYSHWLFVESEDFLRYEGAYDKGKYGSPRIIEANYVESRMNCVDSTTLYAVCCKSECTDILQNLELKLQESKGKPEQIAALVSDMSSRTVEAPRKLPDELLKKLRAMAKNGEVQLHSHAFELWLHQAFPRECPKPSSVRTSNMMTASEWMAGEFDDLRDDLAEFMAATGEDAGSDGSTGKFYFFVGVAAIGFALRNALQRGAWTAQGPALPRVSYALICGGSAGAASESGRAMQLIFAVGFTTQLVIAVLRSRAKAKSLSGCSACCADDFGKCV
eukprot:TRINITY_DN45568_c0_g1_i1.p1 TRINITY_DN45568_c0_g1~~TRINITY_DN45568_c0_g1_i1.p1  ORF type:complete len:628 (-),score=128.48 TRINITY_DN45568_c0_g1_i1:47-1870(-)